MKLAHFGRQSKWVGHMPRRLLHLLPPPRPLWLTTSSLTLDGTAHSSTHNSAAFVTGFSVTKVVAKGIWDHHISIQSSWCYPFFTSRLFRLRAFNNSVLKAHLGPLSPHWSTISTLVHYLLSAWYYPFLNPWLSDLRAYKGSVLNPLLLYKKSGRQGRHNSASDTWSRTTCWAEVFVKYPELLSQHIKTKDTKKQLVRKIQQFDDHIGQSSHWMTSFESAWTIYQDRDYNCTDIIPHGPKTPLNRGLPEQNNGVLLWTVWKCFMWLKREIFDFHACHFTCSCYG